jgi:transposase
MTRESSTSGRKVKAEDRRLEALDLRKQGYSYEAIGSRLGVTRGAAYKSVKTALDTLKDEVYEGAEALRLLEMERLDSLFEKAYTAAMAGDLVAIDKAVKLMERRARLCGLDESTRMEISGSLLTSPQWIELRGILIRTLAAYPDAQKAVLQAINTPRELEAVTE